MPGTLTQQMGATEAPRAAGAWRAYLLGVGAALPIVLGVFPFGVITGALAGDLGMSLAQALGMSAATFAGAGQLACLQLLASGAPQWVAVLAGAVVNLRFTMYSAAVAPFFRPLSPWRKALYAFLLTDQGFALAVDHYGRQGRPLLQGAFYLGISSTLWLAWIGGTYVGSTFGALVPAGGVLDFVIPLIFLGLLVPAVEDRASLAAALTSGAVMVLARDLPLRLGLVAAALAGIGAGLLAEGRADR